MIRQLGTASLFCSFALAETQWIHVLRILFFIFFFILEYLQDEHPHYLQY